MELSKRIKKKKENEKKCQNAIAIWKEHCAKLEAKISDQENELKNLRPSKKKARKFEELCKTYHETKNNIEKLQRPCQETQTNITYEGRLIGYNNNDNKENINLRHSMMNNNENKNRNTSFPNLNKSDKMT